MDTINSEESLVRISHIGKSFEDLEVLKDISLEVKPGEVVSIIGPSGSGKSTLLRCATLLETMDRGSLSYLGHECCHDDGSGSVYVSKSDLRKMHQYFGLVFQDYNLFPHYSVLKNVMDVLVRVRKEPVDQARARALELLERFNLSDKADAYPCQLSGGQQQRVSVARALALDPKVLYLDEPTSALDPELTAEVLKVLRQLADAHMTMIIVTHELAFAKEVSDRMIFMENGHIVEQGTPEELFGSDKQRVKEFIGMIGK